MNENSYKNNYGEWSSFTLASDTLSAFEKVKTTEQQGELLRGALDVLAKDEISKDDSIETPIGAFWRLLSEEDNSLNQFLDAHPYDLTLIIALLLFISHAEIYKKNTDQYFKELIEGGFRLSNHRIRTLQAQVTNSETAKKSQALAQERSIMTRQAKAEEKRREVAEYIKRKPNEKQERIAFDMNMSQSTVCRILKELKSKAF